MFPRGAKIGIQNYLSKLFWNFHCLLLQKYKSNPQSSAQICYGPAKPMEKTSPTRVAQVTGPRMGYQDKGNHIQMNSKGNQLLWNWLATNYAQERSFTLDGSTLRTPEIPLLGAASMLSNQGEDCILNDSEMFWLLMRLTFHSEPCHSSLYLCPNPCY